MPDTLVRMTVRPPDNLTGYVVDTLTRHGFEEDLPAAGTVVDYDGMFCGVEFTQGSKSFIINFAPSILSFKQGDEWVGFEALV